uniref:Minor capsid protein P9 transmembrane helices domain-containing protein n=1 Tax=viral metagenome TaxID=1070528 RepID=A0A6C0CNY9_9ZZZZ
MSNEIIDIPKELQENNIQNDTLDKESIKPIEFWGQNPNVLLDPSHISELFPVSDMEYEQKLNAITRTVIILTFVFYLFLRSWRVIIVSAFTIFALWLIYMTQSKKKKVRFTEKEGFENKVTEDYLETQEELPDDIFGESNYTNPLQNVLISDYDSPTSKKPAPASYTAQSQETILEQAKRMINNGHPEEPKITDKLFKSLGDKLEFEQSMRPFYSTPSTTIPNDQGAFVDFCYGSMVSCKEGNPFACARNLARHIN